ncbi:hypothetical protein, partial [Klebsiella pneumoniae]|uniref:hypothetical protein n=1 Tax=Klebsiella pneumoniae TaxID=573 RepID=UPI0019D7121E
VLCTNIAGYTQLAERKQFGVSFCSVCLRGDTLLPAQSILLSCIPSQQKATTAVLHLIPVTTEEMLL